MTPLSDGGMAEAAAAHRLRRALHAILLFSIGATAVELVLLEHTESWIQLIPLVALGAGLLVGAAALVRPGRASLLALRTLMLLFIAAGIAGLYFHYRGNAEFELERRPTLAGWELLRRTLQGATPALSPGVMVQLGLIGLLVTWRDPRLHAQDLLARRD